MKSPSDLQISPSFRIGIRYGLLLGIIYVIFELFRLSTGTHYRTTKAHLTFRVLAIVIITLLALHRYHKKNPIKTSIKAVLILGLEIGVTTSLIFILYNFILTSFIEPDYYATYSEVFRPDHAANHPNLTLEQVDEDVKMGLAAAWQISIVAFVFTTVGAVILALCSHVAIKKFKPLV